MVREVPLSSNAKHEVRQALQVCCAARGGVSFRVKECVVFTDGE
ncbi:hypothetical protein [Paenibacillus terricola]|nr:hypothetical protein [Paenibacillus terricola]